KKGEFHEELKAFVSKGLIKVRIDGQFYNLEEEKIVLDKKKPHTIDILIDRLEVKQEETIRLKESLEQALQIGSGSVIIFDPQTQEEHFYSLHGYSPQS